MEGSSPSLWLAHLPPDTPEYKYEGLEQLEATGHGEHTYIVVTDISPDEVHENDERFPGRAD
ncbi:hypothetical protein AJ80_02933 [Polytolypa hystricis UAMH7299]|uniref:Uncharacterized protein n=1 Tax=Polytolypa hystricis (strain UAMH7299) TaxID=1447883 RepID=A0A2B7YQ60_POLH7|nr:hypothetical protein AJ80_02933 [Polytolypa hystricis UAMH7299]